MFVPVVVVEEKATGTGFDPLYCTPEESVSAAAIEFVMLVTEVIVPELTATEYAALLAKTTRCAVAASPSPYTNGCHVAPEASRRVAERELVIEVTAVRVPELTMTEDTESPAWIVLSAVAESPWFTASPIFETGTGLDPEYCTPEESMRADCTELVTELTVTEPPTGTGLLPEY
jgi:hypothetical protein